MSRKNQRVITNFAGAFIAMTALVSGCTGEFDDETKAVLEKPELLSIVLDPPEAAPGQSVRASFLFADENGPLDAPLVFWEIPQPAVVGEGAMNATIEFTVGQKQDYSFDETGPAPQSVMVAIPGEGVDVADLSGDLEEVMRDDRIVMGMRTLVVSTRKDKNENPVVERIEIERESGERVSMPIVTSADADIAATREAAVKSPLRVEENEELTILATVEDEDDPNDLRYQWIATGGDFEGRRKAAQPYRAPALEGGEESRVVPVWLIVRDNGHPEHLGQVWAELYLEVAQSASVN